MVFFFGATMKNKFKILTIAISLGFITACIPAPPIKSEKSAVETASAIDEAAIKASFQQMVPNQEVSDVGMSQIEGLVRFSGAGQIFYASPDGKYLMRGDMIEVATRKSMTQEAFMLPRQETFDKLFVEKTIKLEEAITFQSPNQKYEVLVFTDVGCGFCRRIQEDIKGYLDRGITIHYLPWPRSGLQGEVHDLMVSIWCSKDQKKAMDNAKHDKPVKPATCENPIDKYFKLGQNLRITGTPAIFTLDGRQVGQGYLPAEQMEKELMALTPIVDKVR